MRATPGGLNMRLNFNMPMLERMSEGVVLLNRQAQVVAHNAASSAWIALCRDKEAALKILIEQATMGRVELPVCSGLIKTDSPIGC